jgi:hypothetical protein
VLLGQLFFFLRYFNFVFNVSFIVCIACGIFRFSVVCFVVFY